jgi:hypothetical protein
MLKMLVNAAGWSHSTPQSPTFADVPLDNAFYTFVETAARRGIISGYACGQHDAEPCDSMNRPYFRSSSYITRGQVSKVVALALGYESVESSTPTFADVPTDSPFYEYIEALASRGILGGYTCGQDLREPCDANSRPYFRSTKHVTRGQVSKIITNGFSSP